MHFRFNSFPILQAILLLTLGFTQVVTAQDKTATDEKSTSKKSELIEIKVKSSLDQSDQPSLLYLPESAANNNSGKPTPMLVFLHSWSADYTQKNSDWFQQAKQRGWIYLHPNFRGINKQPEACGSELARQDILDAIQQVIKNYRVDTSRIYLAGRSGGGHMTMLMAGYYPDRFSAASAWVGISDLKQWYEFHTINGKVGKYAKQLEACCGGVPGSSPKADDEYKQRSPIYHLKNVGDLPLDLNAGIHDGHTGSVSIDHTLNAFNVIAEQQKQELISQEVIDDLVKNRKLSNPNDLDHPEDATYERKIHFRRIAGPTRVTIFEGGHEGLAKPACEWLSKQTKKTAWEE